MLEKVSKHFFLFTRWNTFFCLLFFSKQIDHYCRGI